MLWIPVPCRVAAAATSIAMLTVPANAIARPMSTLVADTNSWRRRGSPDTSPCRSRTSAPCSQIACGITVAPRMPAASTRLSSPLQPRDQARADTSQ